MRYSALFKVLSSLCPISEEFKAALERDLIPISRPKNYLLIEAPRITDYAYFIESGIAISYSYSKGKKIIESLWRANDIIVLPKSFFSQTPTTEHLQLMTEGELLCISYTNVMSLFENFPEANTLYRAVANNMIEKYKMKVRDMQTMTTSERLEKLLREQPDIEQILTQENVASYLGITPQSLSRIKRLRS